MEDLKELKPYQAPTLTVHGDVAVITLAATAGTQYDHPIPAGPIPPPGTPNFS
jgi:hypothetical protein